MPTIAGLQNANTPLDGTERVPVVQAGITKDVSAQAIADLALGAVADGVLAEIAQAGEDQAAAVETAGQDQVAIVAAAPGSKEYASKADGISNGLSSVSVTAGGSGATTPGNYPFTTTGGTGTGAAGYVTVSAGAIISAAVEHRGRGYTTGESLVYTIPGLTGTVTLVLNKTQNQPAGSTFRVRTANGGVVYSTNSDGLDATAIYTDPSYAAVVAVSNSVTAALANLIATGTQQLGRPIDPITGTAASAAAVLLHDPIADSGYGGLAAYVVGSLKIFQLAAGALTLYRYTKSGTTYTKGTTVGTATLVAGNNNTSVTLTGLDFGLLTSDIPVALGEYLVLSAASKWALNSATTADGTGFAAVDPSGASISNPTFVTTNRLQIQVNIKWSYQVVSATTFQAQQAAVAAMQTNVTADTAAVALLKQTVPQQIGRPVDPIDASAVGVNTIIMAIQVAADSVLKSWKFFAHANGNVRLARATKSGTDYTIQALTNLVAVTTGAQALLASGGGDLGVFNFLAGDYIALVNCAGVVTLGGSTVDDSGGYSYSNTAGTTVGAVISNPTPLLNNRLEVQFNLEATSQLVTAANFLSAIGGGSLSLANADKIVTDSNSFYEAAYALLGNSPTQVVSALSEYNFGNFAKGGQTANAMMIQSVNGTTYFGSTFPALKPKYAILSEFANARATGGANQTDAQYRATFQSWIDTVKGLGIRPIVATEYGGAGVLGPVIDGEASGVKLLRAVAQANDVPFIDVASKSKRINPSVYAPFWRLGHPGVRVSDMFVQGLRVGLKQLPRPERSMKIFRVRGTVTVSSVASLMFRTVGERHHLFRELYIGHMALSESEKIYFDAGSEPSHSLYTSNQTQADEYVALAGGASTSLGTYALIDCVLPVSSPKGLTVTLSDTTCTVYARQIGSAGQAWVQLSLVNGAYAVPDSARLVDRDRLALLVFKAGGISLNASPVVNWTSGVTREIRHPVPLSPPRGAEMMAQPLTVVSGAVPVAWSNPGSLAVVTPADGILPTGTTGCVVATSSAAISQSLTFTAADDPIEISVRIVARNFPAIFNAAQSSSADFTTSPITYETCNQATLQMTLSGTSGVANASAVLTEQVGLGWWQFEFRETIPAGTANLMVTVGSADFPIQVAEVSTKPVLA
jgi:hypothetical protein